MDVEPSSRLQEVQIPLDEPVGDVAAVSGLLGVPEWWPTGSRIGVVIGHGSGRDLDDPLITAVQRGLTERKVLALRFNFPFAQARKPRPDPLPVLERAFRHAVAVLARDPSAAPAHLFIGGMGIGAQAAVQCAAARMRVDGVFALGYPLHSRDQPDKNVRADALFRIVAPILFVQGTRDRNCDLDALRRTLTRVGAPKTLHVIDEADGALAVPRRSGRPAESVHAEVLEAIDVWCRKVIAS
jgi:predicted alpha/beta-hydrolase family hydrolase